MRYAVIYDQIEECPPGRRMHFDSPRDNGGIHLKQQLLSPEKNPLLFT
jgi:hypothetical protein